MSVCSGECKGGPLDGQRVTEPGPELECETLELRQPAWMPGAFDAAVQTRHRYTYDEVLAWWIYRP